MQDNQLMQEPVRDDNASDLSGNVRTVHITTIVPTKSLPKLRSGQGLKTEDSTKWVANLFPIDGTAVWKDKVMGAVARAASVKTGTQDMVFGCVGQKTHDGITPYKKDLDEDMTIVTLEVRLSSIVLVDVRLLRMMLYGIPPVSDLNAVRNYFRNAVTNDSLKPSVPVLYAFGQRCILDCYGSFRKPEPWWAKIGFLRKKFWAEPTRPTEEFEFHHGENYSRNIVDSMLLEAYLTLNMQHAHEPFHGPSCEAAFLPLRKGDYAIVLERAF